jgi:hypothetical protein
MNAPDFMLGHLATAQARLLTPFDLNEDSLRRALQLITAHRVDDADLYFQTTRSEGWSLEEGIVKSGSFSIDQGVGVRAVVGEKTAFAYSDSLSEAALNDCATTVRTTSPPPDRASAPRCCRGTPRACSSTGARTRSPASTAAPRWPCWSASSAWRARQGPGGGAGDGRAGRRARDGADRARRRACWRPMCGRWCACR